MPEEIFAIETPWHDPETQLPIFVRVSEHALTAFEAKQASRHNADGWTTFSKALRGETGDGPAVYITLRRETLSRVLDAERAESCKDWLPNIAGYPALDGRDTPPIGTRRRAIDLPGEESS